MVRLPAGVTDFNFPPSVQNDSGVHKTSCSPGSGTVLRRYSAQVGNLTTQLHLTSRLGKNGTVVLAALQTESFI